MKSFASNEPAGSLLFLLVLAALLFSPFASATEIEVTRASAGYRDSREFQRISEFFTGRENTGGDVIVRSNPEERAGFYVTVQLKKYPYSELVDEAARLEIILPGDIEPTLFTFPLQGAKRRNPLILIGLTGDDWPDPSARPLAWRVSFTNAAGEILASEQSFLWGK